MDPYDIGRAFAEIEEELIESMIRNMRRHRLEESAENKEWMQWQVEQLRALEEYKRRNKEKFRGRFNEINDLIDKAIKEARAQGSMDQEIEILEYIKKGFSGYKKVDATVMGEFFKLNDRKLEALIKATKEDFKSGEQAILRMAEDQYRQVIFNAQMYANTGAGTYEKAVDMATKDFLSRGINCIEYANGARHTMKDYADMAIRTAAKRAYLAGEGEKRKEWGISTVIVNKRGNACPKCVPFVGKVLIDDVYSGGSRKDGKYPLLSRAMELGLYHPRCKDSHSTYFPGISTADDKWTKEELEAIGEDYKQEQKQQYAQRQAEKFERLAKFSLDKENQERYVRKADMWKHARFKTGGIDSREYAYAKTSLANSKQLDIMGLTDNEAHAINQYLSFESYLVNDKLRNGLELSELERMMVSNLDSALEKIPKYEGDLSRSLYFGDDEMVSEFLSQFIVGKDVTFREYISTTNSLELHNPDGEVQIFIQNAKNGRNLSGINKRESEVLYERGSKFDVVNIVEHDGKHYILLEEK
ncbi:MAG: phage minor capsid protein [Agathobacter sp.]